jgi:hypothetical protein
LLFIALQWSQANLWETTAQAYAFLDDSFAGEFALRKGWEFSIDCHNLSVGVNHDDGSVMVDWAQESHDQQGVARVIGNLQGKAHFHQIPITVDRSHYLLQSMNQSAHFTAFWCLGIFLACFSVLSADELEEKIVVKIGVYIRHGPSDILTDQRRLFIAEKSLSLWVAVGHYSQSATDWVQCDHAHLIC